MRQLATHVLCLVLIPMLARGAPPSRALEPVEVREYDGGWGRQGVQLIFKRLPPDRDQGALTREDGQAIRAAFEEVYGKQGTVLLMGALLSTEASAAKAAIKAARTTGGCREDNSKGDAPEHHIATDKNGKAEVRGGPWTPQFELLFERAGMSLDDPANKLFVIGHKGPHPEQYHQEVYDRLNDAIKLCAGPDECRRKLTNALDEIAGDICGSGSRLNKLVTKKP